jgi:hypothetical protein
MRSQAEPLVKLAGHTASPKRVLFLDEVTLVSGGEDKAIM